MPVVLSRAERLALRAIARRRTAPLRDVQRARIVLLANGKESNAAIAREVGCCLNTVRLWRDRFVQERLAGLSDKPRSGRPCTYSADDVAHVKAMACELPATRGLPLSRFSLAELAAEIGKEGRACPSVSTIGRWLREDALRPWTYRSWITPRAPQFFEKASRVLDLYQGMWKGEPLREDDVVLCADEKTCIQALRRPHPVSAPAAGHVGHVESTYSRRGVLTYQAALVVGSGKVMGGFPEENSIETFDTFVDSVMAKEPCRSAGRVFWITDNGAVHQPKTFPDRLRARHPKAISVHLPVHASWLNQIEIYFGIVQRKALTPNDFPHPGAIRKRLAGFERHYGKTARPFSWKYTKTDLKATLRRLDEKRPSPESTIHARPYARQEDVATRPRST